MVGADSYPAGVSLVPLLVDVSLAALVLNGLYMVYKNFIIQLWELAERRELLAGQSACEYVRWYKISPTVNASVVG